MPNVKLTKIGVERLRPPKTGRLEYWDTIVPGFHLRVTSSGVKTYALMARVRGSQFRMTLGRHGAIDLDEARTKARKALEKVEQGEDPRDDKRRARAAPSDLVDDVIEDFITRYVERENRPRSAEETKRALRQRIRPAWTGRSIRDITRREIIDLLDDIAAASPANANRTRATIGKLFSWSMDRGIVDASPAARLPAPAPVVERERVLTDRELSILIEAFGRYGEPFGPFMLMLALTGQRRSEVATMQWAHVDLDAALWTIPPELTKANRTHEVPLSRLAVETLGAIEWRGPFVFTTRTFGDKPISGYSKAKALIDAEAEKIVAERGEREPVGAWRLHDLRRTCGTRMARLGIADETISRVLNHAEGGVTKIYRRYSYLTEKRHALDAWAVHIEGLIGARAAENVVDLRAVVG